MNSIPLPDSQKNFLNGCVECHTLARPMQSKFTVDQWPDYIKLMASMSAESTPAHPQPLIPGPRDRTPPQKVLDAESKVLAQVNLSSGTRTFPLKPSPRPTGRSTHVIITEYDLPNKNWWPHDVTLDAEGNIWFGDFGDQFVGEMDPKTFKVTPIALPTVKNDGSPLGNLDIEWGPEGNLWVAEMYQGAIAEVNPKTKEVKTFKLPDEIQNPSTQESFVAPQHSNVDGYVWTTNQDDHSGWRLNLKTGKFDKGTSEKTAEGEGVPAYQFVSDSKNNLFLLNFGGTLVGYVDKTTGIAQAYKTPTPNARPRRGVVDHEDRVWYSEYNANAIGMFDPEAKKLTEWKLPSDWGDPYGLDYSDKYNEAWTGSELTDKVSRLDVKSGQFTEYPLPHSTNIRRVFIDNRGKLPVLWVGNNHAAQIIKVEPLD
jgi:streptogramin lyase